MRHPIHTTFRRRREALGLTQRDVGVLSDQRSPQSTVSAAELGRSTGAVVQAIDAALSSLERTAGIRPEPPSRTYRLRERRIALNLSFRQVAELSGFETSVRGELRVESVERNDRAPDGDVRQVRLALLWEETRDRRRREEQRIDQARIHRQESIWNAIPDSPAKAELQAAMLDRALQLMHLGDGEAADAITEWLPKDAVNEMYAQWDIEVIADFRCDKCEPEPIKWPLAA